LAVLPEYVIPAEAGIHKKFLRPKWMPAFAGMTVFFANCIFNFRHYQVGGSGLLSKQMSFRRKPESIQLGVDASPQGIPSGLSLA
jgi:hypothetical protein